MQEGSEIQSGAFYQGLFPRIRAGLSRLGKHKIQNNIDRQQSNRSNCRKANNKKDIGCFKSNWLSFGSTYSFKQLLFLQLQLLQPSPSADSEDFFLEIAKNELSVVKV